MPGEMTEAGMLYGLPVAGLNRAALCLHRGQNRRSHIVGTLGQSFVDSANAELYYLKEHTSNSITSNSGY